MKRFKNILYFADGATENCRALQRAFALARSNDARLTVMDVLEEADSSPTIDKVFGTDLNRILQERRQHALEQLVEPFNEADALVYCRVVSGIAFVEVIRAVISRGYDLVIKAARQPQGLSERILGSTDMHLLRKCPCPVWIDRPGAAYPYSSVLAAVDPMDEPGAGCDRLVMDLATSLAQRESARLDVVHAWEMHGESLLGDGRYRVSRTELEHLLEMTRNKHEQRLADLLAGYGIDTGDTGVHLLKGTAARTIIQLSQTLASDVIVMGTLGRTGVPGLFIGNTAENVMQNIDASILAVKPEGFVSPVLVK